MKKSTNSIVITGVGVATPLGMAVSGLWSNLLEGKTAARSWADLEKEGYRSTCACRIDDISHPPFRRGRQLALAAAENAIQQSGGLATKNTGIFLGSTLGESAAFEYAATGRPIDLKDYSVHSIADSIAERYGISSVPTAVATACAAGNYAIGMAWRALKQGRVSMAIAGGAEPFSRLAMVGFSRSRAMSNQYCRPFDLHRNGMLLGEGAALFVLERAEDALARGATPLAEVLSLGLSSDAYHPVAPLPDGAGMRNAIELALQTAGVLPEVVDWVNTHGSGTRLSDVAESKALNQVFSGKVPICSGSKGALGHALGAASAIELALCVQGIQTQIIPPTFGHAQADPECNIPCLLQPQPANIQYVLNCAFAFGGLNSALLIRSWNP
ncbi:MAG: beta-ketoacyl-[acyl-carrier-protein] synthase family protein [Saprospiraceae bacterium]